MHILLKKREIPRERRMIVAVRAGGGDLREIQREREREVILLEEG